MERSISKESREMNEVGVEPVILAEEQSCSKCIVAGRIFSVRYSVKVSIHKAQRNKKMHEK